MRVKLALLALAIAASPGLCAEGTGSAVVVFRAGDVTTLELEPDLQVARTFDGLTRLARANHAGAARIASAAKNAGAEVFTMVRSNTLSTDQLVARLRRRDDVLAVTPNCERHVLDTMPNDPGFADYVWGVAAVNAPFVWDYATGDDEIYTAVIDTGIDYTHGDISPNFCHEHSASVYEGDLDDYDDYHGHGTHVAGTIAARGDNNYCIAGVTWRGKVISIRAFGPTGVGDVESEIAALDRVAGILTDNPDLNLAAVNISLGGYADEPPDRASNAGDAEWLALHNIDLTGRTMLVIASGNDGNPIGAATGDDEYFYPASFHNLENFIVVGAVNEDLTRANYSNYSTSYVHVAAPGTKIFSTAARRVIDGELVCMTGTSMAAPHVTGAVALLKSAFPRASMPEIRDAILWGANGTLARDFTRHGLLDLRGAYRVLDRKFGTGVSVRSRLRGLITTGGANPWGVSSRAFANAIYTRLFNVSALTGYTADNAGAASYGKSSLVGNTGKLKRGDTAQVKALFMGQNVRPGSFVQMSRRVTHEAHSAIVDEITSDTLRVYHTAPSGSNKVLRTTYSWSNLLRLWDNFSVYSPLDPTLK